MSSVPDSSKVEDVRSYYVGLTRAKRNLYLLQNQCSQSTWVSVSLSMHDVWLDFCKSRKTTILQLRSGNQLTYRDGYLFNEQGLSVAALSTTGKGKLKAWLDKGYEVVGAEVSYTVAWRPNNADTDYAVCLANVVLERQ